MLFVLHVFDSLSLALSDLYLQFCHKNDIPFSELGSMPAQCSPHEEEFDNIKGISAEKLNRAFCALLV